MIEAVKINNWRDALIRQDATMQTAVQSLDRTGFQIAIVADDVDKLVGTITDGDIRRGLLRGLTLTSPITSITQTRPFVVPPSVDLTAAVQIMLRNGVRQLPIVNEYSCIVGLYALGNVATLVKRNNLMVVMAGGKGTRLRPHTEHCPKPMLEVAGKPMLEHILERAIADGFGRFTFAVHYLGHMIEDYFGDGVRWNVDITYAREEEPLGTGGALGLLEKFEDEPVLVTNGDVLTDIRYDDILDFHNKHSAVATMAVRAHEWQNPFGVVKVNGMDIIGFEEKPLIRSHINAGIYVIHPHGLRHVKKDEYCDMPHLFERIRNDGERIIVYPMHEPWLDVGRPDDLATAQNIHRGLFNENREENSYEDWPQP